MAAGFMAGFGTQLSKLIEEDRQYYRDAAAKRRDYIQTYGTRAVVERENQANAAMGTMNYLISNGIPKEDVRYVLDTSGVQGIAQLKATLDSRDDLTKEEKTQLVKKAKDYVAKNPDEDLNTIVKRAYGLYKSESNPVKRERSMFASMLGLDSKMMEDDVLDDMYINGMTGRDIYRIMGSAGPQAGAPLDLNVPTKAPSPTILNNTAKFLESQFDTSISSRIEALKRSQLVKDKDGNSVAAPDFDKIQSEITKLENLKAKGLLGLGKYATEYDPSLFNFARAQEDALPGAITRNSYLFEFLPAYKTFFEEAVDDAKIDAANKVIKFETEQAAMDAAERGELKEGQQIQVGNNTPQVFKPKSKMNFDVMTEAPVLAEDPTSPAFIAPASGVKLTPTEVTKVENAFNPVVSEEQNLTVQDQAELRFQAVDSFQKKAGRAVLGTMKVLDDIGAIVERKTQQAYWKANDYMATGLGLAAQTLGFEDTAKALYEYGIKNRNAGSETPLWSKTINNWLDSVGVADFTEGKNLPTKEPKSDEVQTNAAKAAVDEIFENVANMSAEEKAAKIEEIKAVAKAYKKSLKDYNSSAAALYGKVQDTETGGGTFSSKNNTSVETKTEAEKKARDLTGYPVVGMPKNADEVVSDRAQPATPESEAAPSVNVANMGMEGLLTKRDRGQSLMSKPKEVGTEAAPKLGGAEFQALLARVHGSDSKVSTDFQDKVSSGKIKAADVTRLIKSTQGLPKTKSRDTLLMSLYDLRDALNKR